MKVFFVPPHYFVYYPSHPCILMHTNAQRIWIQNETVYKFVETMASASQTTENPVLHPWQGGHWKRRIHVNLYGSEISRRKSKIQITASIVNYWLTRVGRISDLQVPNYCERVRVKGQSEFNRWLSPSSCSLALHKSFWHSPVWQCHYGLSWRQGLQPRATQGKELLLEDKRCHIPAVGPPSPVAKLLFTSYSALPINRILFFLFSRSFSLFFLCVIRFFCEHTTKCWWLMENSTIKGQYCRMTTFYM